MKYLLILLIIGVLFILYEVYEHQHIKITYKTIDLSGQKTIPKRVVLLSDIHDNKKMNLSAVLTKIRDFCPEMILICGDAVNKKKEAHAESISLIRDLSAICPVYFSLGNHEEYLRQTDSLYDFLSDIAPYCTILDNSSVCKDSVCIGGITLSLDFFKKGRKKDKILPDMPAIIDFPNNMTNILLAHDPYYVEKYIESFSPDIIFSGHFHGGIVRLPVLGGLVSPHFSKFKYDKGKYSVKNHILFVSGGFGSHTLKIRFFNPVEINMITIFPKEI